MLNSSRNKMAAESALHNSSKSKNEVDNPLANPKDKLAFELTEEMDPFVSKLGLEVIRKEVQLSSRRLQEVSLKRAVSLSFCHL